MERSHSALDAVDRAPAPQSSGGLSVRASPVLVTTAPDPSVPRPDGDPSTSFGVRLRRTSKKVRQTLLSDKMAVAHVVMFIITAAIFLPAIAVLFVYLDDTGENQKPPTGAIHMRAQQTLLQLTSSKGLTESGKTDWNNYGEPWTGATDHKLDEVGLVSDDGRVLSYDKIRMIQQGRMQTSVANGFLDYPELKSVLNMGDRYDLRIRSYPVVTSSVGNPYGSDPIQGKHVGYVAALTNSEISVGTDDFGFPTARATAEIEALKLLKLTTDPSSETNGFDADWYQPCCTSSSPNAYSGAAVIEGDVIATTSRTYATIEEPLVPIPYLDHFFDSYFKLEDGSYRFDALVFGSDVDLTLWNTDKARAALTAFLDSGRAIVFLGSTTTAEGLVNKCGATADCLLRDEDAHAPFTTPDSTNPILSTPNKLNHQSYDSSTAGGDWPICDDDRNGFIPILMVSGSASSPGCTEVQKVMLGITAGDRYDNGGTLVLSAYDVTKSTMANKHEAARYYSNILNIALLRAAYIDFGPSLPDQAPVEHAERILLIEFPDGTKMDLALQVYVWRTG
ncbi:MAG: hypothetical protein KY455_01320 [Euryarchaeota archaeon]|nr:hypothetical protein [Euryarchaeota archaeon]